MARPGVGAAHADAEAFARSDAGAGLSVVGESRDVVQVPGVARTADTFDVRGRLTAAPRLDPASTERIPYFPFRRSCVDLISPGVMSDFENVAVSGSQRLFTYL
jgi:hypothetical protein